MSVVYLTSELGNSTDVNQLRVERSIRVQFQSGIHCSNKEDECTTGSLSSTDQSYRPRTEKKQKNPAE